MALWSRSAEPEQQIILSGINLDRIDESLIEKLVLFKLSSHPRNDRY